MATERAVSLSHIDLSATAVDLTSGLNNAAHEVQAVEDHLLYFVGGDSAPSDIDDFWSLGIGGVINFMVGSGQPSVWARLASGAGRAVIRRWPDVNFPTPLLSRPHADIGTSPIDIRGALPEGNYRARAGADILVYFGTAGATASIDDFWPVRQNSLFNFCAGAATDPVFVRTETGTAILKIQGGPAA